MFFKKLKNLTTDIFYISRLTNVKNKKKILLLNVILSNLTVLFDLITITVFASLFSKVDSSNLITEYVVKNIYLLPVIILLRYLSVYFEKTLIYNLQLNVNESLRRFLLNDIYKKGNYSISDASFFLTQLTEHVSQFYGAMALILSTLTQLIIYLSYLIYTDFKTITYFLVFVVLLIFPSIKLLKVSRIYTDKYYNFGQKIVRDIEKVIDNLFLIKIYDTKDEEFKTFDEKIKNFSISKFKNYKFGTINFLIPNFAILFVMSFLIAFTNIVKTISLEFVGVLLRLVQTLGVINNNLNLLINSHVHLEKFSEIEKNKPDRTRVEYSELNNSDFSIILENVEFKYFGASNNLYENLNLNIYRDKHTVITGANGTGKSTLLGLLSGVFIPSKGKIYTSSKKLGYVGASPLIINGSLKQNLLYGNIQNLKNEILINQVKNIKLFGDKEPDLNMIISNKNLSSGQMQKISFLRAILANIEILFLDESTSNLDEESKMLISRLLDEMNITIVNCSHNPDDFNYDYKVDVKSNGLTSMIEFSN